eukprot:5489254-Pleurochrysis_carterae.AAC.1
MRHGDGLAAEHEGYAFRGLEVVEWLFSARVAVNRRVMHKAAKNGGVIGNVWSSHRGGVEDASDELE